MQSSGKIIVGMSVVALFLYFSKEFMKRGIRNNNPMNIKHSSNQWVGAYGVQSDDVFVQFESPMFGLRAGAKTLLTYERVHFLSSIRSIINRWAPPSDDNPTSKYVDFVASQVGVDPDMFISVRDHLAQLLPAIVEFENGENPYTVDTYREAINDALNG